MHEPVSVARLSSSGAGGTSGRRPAPTPPEPYSERERALLKVITEQQVQLQRLAEASSKLLAANAKLQERTRTEGELLKGRNPS